MAKWLTPFRVGRWTRRAMVGSVSGRLGRYAARKFLNPWPIVKPKKQPPKENQ